MPAPATLPVRPTALAWSASGPRPPGMAHNGLIYRHHRAGETYEQTGRRVGVPVWVPHLDLAQWTAEMERLEAVVAKQEAAYDPAHPCAALDRHAIEANRKWLTEAREAVALHRALDADARAERRAA